MYYLSNCFVKNLIQIQKIIHVITYMLRQTGVAIVHEASYCHHSHNDGYVPTQPMDYTSQYPNQNQS